MMRVVLEASEFTGFNGSANLMPFDEATKTQGFQRSTHAKTLTLSAEDGVPGLGASTRPEQP